MMQPPPQRPPDRPTSDAPLRGPQAPGREPSELPNLFRKDGDYWTISFEGRTSRLRDCKGLRYVAHLLRHPDRDLHAIELVAAAGGALVTGNGDRHVVEHTQDSVALHLGDAGPLLDAQARVEYQQRAVDLRADLEEAQTRNDLGRARRVRDELEFLVAELAAAGRGRRAASHAERARVTVTKGIKNALTKLAEVNPPLAWYLAATVKRGYFCSYTPDPRNPIRWEV